MSKQKQKSNHVPTKSEKLFSSWGKNIAKGIVRTKQLAVQKIAKAPETPINDALKIKLQRYKYTKYEMIDISNIFNEMYQTKFNQKKNTDLLCRVFNNLYTNADADDKFGQFCHKMGTNLGKTIGLEGKATNDVNRYLVKPFSEFCDNDMDKTGKLKLKWKTIKAEYDYRHNDYVKCKNKQPIDQDKLKHAKDRLDDKLNELNKIRKEFGDSMTHLEMIKAGKMQDTLHEYFKMYREYASNLNAVINLGKTININPDIKPKPKPTINGANNNANITPNVNGHANIKPKMKPLPKNKPLPTNKPPINPNNKISKPTPNGGNYIQSNNNNNNNNNVLDEIEGDTKDNTGIDDESSEEPIDREELMRLEEERKEQERLAKKKNMPYWQTNEYKQEQDTLKKSLNHEIPQDIVYDDDMPVQKPQEFVGKPRLTVDMTKAKNNLVSAYIPGLGYKPT